jgi:hypothetical protein
MKNLSFIFLTIFLFSQCERPTNNTPIDTFQEPVSRDLNDSTKKAILQKIDSFNTDSFCIYETPTYERLSNDPNIHTDIKDRMDIRHLFEQKNNKMDSLRLTKTDTSIAIHELFFIHGHYDFVPSYIINDTSIQIKTIEVVIAELTHYAEKKELITIDVTIAHAAEIITELKIKRQDRTNKVIYYNNRKLVL